MHNLSYAIAPDRGTNPLKNMIFREILTPLSSRIGTIAAGAVLSGYYADTSLIQELGSALAAVLLVGCDLIFSHFQNKKR